MTDITDELMASERGVLVPAVLLGRTHRPVFRRRAFDTITAIRDTSIEILFFQAECSLAISFRTHAATPPHVLLQRVGEESVLLNLTTETYFGLDAVGTRMWEALTQSATVEAAYRELLETYEVDPNRLRQDMETLIEDLVRNGLLEMSGE